MSIAGATSVLINVTGSKDLTMFEITEASTMIQEEAHEDANVIWGWVVDETMGDEARVTVIATGFDESHLSATPSVERRVAEAMRGSRMVANGNNTGGGYRPQMGGSGMVSGVDPNDYDIPTFFRNADYGSHGDRARHLGGRSSFWSRLPTWQRSSCSHSWWSWACSAVRSWSCEH